MKLLLLACCLLLPLSACRSSEPAPMPPDTNEPAPDGPIQMDPDATVTIRGTLTDEGVECQALRATETDKLYTLTGDLGDFANGDRVEVSGTVAQISYCQQGTTLSVQRITAWPGNE